MTYLPHVDGLRASAILAVVVYHAAPHLAPGGYVGVDVFFVISGFLITSIIVREIAEGRFSFAGFLARRARRIAPALVVVYAATALVALILLLPDTFSSYGRSLFYSSLFAANYYFNRTTDYFSAPAHEKPLLHTWSLSIEEQFYILWPLLLLMIWTWLPRRILPFLIGALAFASLAFSEYMVEVGRSFTDDESIRERTYAFYALSCRAWELLLGACLVFAINVKPAKGWFSEAMAVAGLGAIAGSIFLLTNASRFPGLAALPATMGTAAVIYACHHRTTLVGQALSVRPMVWVGLISYSLYLWHWPILAFGRVWLTPELSHTTIAAFVAISFGAAWLSWRFIELPFRAQQGAFYFPVRRALATAAVCLLATASLGTAIRLGNGLPWRLDERARQVFYERASINPYRTQCDGADKIFGNDDVCAFGHTQTPGQPYDIAIFGDSNADQFVPLVAKLAEQRKLKGRQVTQTACAALLGAWRTNQPEWRKWTCLAYQQQIIKFLDENPQLKLVILASNWASYQYPDMVGHNGLVIDPAAPVTETRGPYEFQRHLETTVAFLRDRGLKVMIIGQVPYVKDLPFACAVSARRRGDSGNDCGFPAKSVRDQIEVSNSAIAEVSKRESGVESRLPSDVICDKEHCYTVMDGLFLYRDHGHLNAVAARHLAQHFQLPILP